MVALSVLRDRVSIHMGDRITGTTTSAGDAGGTTVVCTAMADEDFGADDEAFNAFWLLITSGTDDGNLRRVARTTGYVASSGTFTVTRAFSAQIANSVTFELHRYDPRVKQDAINQAVRHVFSLIDLEVVDETLVVDDRLANSDMETFSGGAFTSWASEGSPTLTQDTATVKHGAGSAKIVAGGSNAALTQSPSIDLALAAGKSVRLEYWAQTGDADSVRVSLNFGSPSADTNGEDMTNDNSWRQISVTADVPTTATKIEARLEVDANKTGFFDAGYMSIGTIYEYTMPSNIIKGPYAVHQQALIDHPEGPYWVPRNSFTTGRRLRLYGTNVFADMTTDTATIAIPAYQENPLTMLAAGICYELLAGSSPVGDIDHFREMGRFWRNAAEAQLSIPAVVTPAHGAQGTRPGIAPWYWTADGTTRKLVLPRTRARSVDV